MSHRLPREQNPTPASLLFIPVIHAHRYLSSLARQNIECLPDALILDLEDSIPEHRKAEARASLFHILTEQAKALPPDVSILVRINAIATRFSESDLQMLSSCESGVLSGVMVSKCADPADLDTVYAAFPGNRIPIVIPLVETLAGHAARDALCARAARLGVRQIAFGAGDMSLELGIERDYESDLLRKIAVDLVISARLHGLDAIDAPARVIPDEDAGPEMAAILERECLWAKRNGMKGKLAIHSAQIPLIARTFSAHSRLSWAQQVLAEFDGQPDNRSLRHAGTGEYMGTPTLKQARAIVAEAGAALHDSKKKP